MFFCLLSVMFEIFVVHKAGGYAPMIKSVGFWFIKGRVVRAAAARRSKIKKADIRRLLSMETKYSVVYP
jgi:hypothetical protein